VKINVSGFDEEEIKSFSQQKKEVIRSRQQLFAHLVENERERTLMMLISRFEKLSYEELEEVYDDGCMMLWEKMMDEEFELIEGSIVGLLRRMCWGVGNHYLRNKKDYVLSLDALLENSDESVGEEDSGLAEIFDVFEEEMSDEERLNRFDEVWKELKKVDKMILTSYYVEDCKLEEVALRVGYKNGNTVRSRKDKVLKKMLKMMQEERSNNSPSLLQNE